MAYLDPTDTTEDIWDFVGSGVGSQAEHDAWCQLLSVGSALETQDDGYACVEPLAKQSGDDEAEDSFVIDYGAMDIRYYSETDDEFLFADPDADGTSANMDRNAIELTEFTIKSENSTNIGSSTAGGSSGLEEEPLTTSSFQIEFDPFF